MNKKQISGWIKQGACAAIAFSAILMYSAESANAQVHFSSRGLSIGSSGHGHGHGHGKAYGNHRGHHHRSHGNYRSQNYGGFNLTIGRSYGGYGFNSIYNRGYGHGGFNQVYRRPVYRDTTHYDYHGPSLRRHGNHFDYVPGHYDLHRTGHWHR